MRIILCLFFLGFTLSYSQDPSQLTQQTKDPIPTLVEKIKDSIVTIRTAQYVAGGVNPFLNNPAYQDFFELFGALGLNLPKQRIERSLGSGVMISEDGFIVTCEHVIRGVDAIQVITSDNRVFQASIESVDREDDLAVLRIVPEKGKNQRFTAAKLGDSSELKVGQRVLALGIPFGVAPWLTDGVISTSFILYNGNLFLGTSAHLNPGNSGGGLFDIEGKLIGVSSAIASRSGGSHGVNFAKPVSLIPGLMKAAQAGHKKLIRPSLGCIIQNLDEEIRATLLSSDSMKGVLVVDVKETGIKHTIKSKDIILTIHGKEIRNEADYMLAEKTLPIGEKVQITLIREGKVITEEILIMPEDVEKSKGTLIEVPGPLKGITVVPLPAKMVLTQESSEAGIDKGASHKIGLLIIEVEPNSQAEQYGFKEGIVLLKLNGEPLNSVDKLTSLVKAANQKNTYQLVYWQDGIRELSIHGSIF